MDNYLSVRFNFSHHCKVNYLFPDLDHPETTILICIDIERS